jgi:hypothetical protein
MIEMFTTMIKIMIPLMLMLMVAGMILTTYDGDRTAL